MVNENLKAPFRVCLWRGCDAFGIQRHLCRLHYGWWPYERYVRGDPIDERKQTRDGYIEARVDGIWALEHRLIFARELGRRLEHHEIVVHLDDDRANNARENLWLTNRRDAAAYHRQRQLGVTT